MDRIRIVVKVGTSTLLREGGGVNLREMDALARVLSDLKNMGHEIILVSSGAIGIGTTKLGLAKRPSELRRKQAAAAVGQCEMMHLYDKFFGENVRIGHKERENFGQPKERDTFFPKSPLF